MCRILWGPHKILGIAAPIVAGRRWQELGPLTGQVHGLQEPGHQLVVTFLLHMHKAQLAAHLLQIMSVELGIEILSQAGLGQL